MKRTYLETAKRLLAEDRDDTLRYVCLELRMCMEAIAYERLAAYSKRLPEDVLKQWQAPQALKRLAMLEPGSNDDYTFAVGVSAVGAKAGTGLRVVGKHESFDLGWLQKTYNKLGNVLHAPSPFQRASRLADPTELRTELDGVVDELERIASSTGVGGIAAILKFDCPRCGRNVAVNIAYALQAGRAQCLSSECGTWFCVRSDGPGSVSLEPIVTNFECVNCKAKTPIDSNKLEIRYRFSCAECGTEHIIGAWGYTRFDAGGTEEDT